MDRWPWAIAPLPDPQVLLGTTESAVVTVTNKLFYSTSERFTPEEAASFHAKWRHLGKQLQPINSRPASRPFCKVLSTSFPCPQVGQGDPAAAVLGEACPAARGGRCSPGLPPLSGRVARQSG